MKLPCSSTRGIIPSKVAATLTSVISSRNALCYAAASIWGRIKEIRSYLHQDHWIYILQTSIISPFVNDLAIPAINSLAERISVIWNGSQDPALSPIPQEEVLDDQEAISQELSDAVLDPDEDQKAVPPKLSDSIGQNDPSQGDEAITDLLSKIQDEGMRAFYEERVFCFKANFIIPALVELAPGLKLLDIWKCGITGKPIRYILKPVVQTQPPLYYDKGAVEDWLATQADKAPKGWPEDKLKVPLKKEYFQPIPEIQALIEASLREFETSSRENLKAEVDDIYDLGG